MSAKGRPEPLTRWITGGRQYNAIVVLSSISQYETTWKSWWMSLQPETRKPEDGSSWPLERVQPDDVEEWESLRRGGCNGFFIIIMGLALWANAVSEASVDAGNLVAAVEDVAWACERIVATLNRGTKRPSSAPVRRSKRVRT